MSFRIKKSHPYAATYSSGSQSTAASAASSTRSSDLLSSDDYLLFNLRADDRKQGKPPVQAKKGGNCIHAVAHAQADFY